MEHMLRGRTATRLNVHMPKRSTKLRTRGLALLIMAIGALLFSGVLAAAPSGGSQGGVTDSNLVAHWPFDAGSTRDVSGNNNDGVGSGITPTSDRFGRHNDAYQFDGVGDRISIANSPTLQIGTSDYTIAAWIRTTAAGSDGRVFSKGSWNCTTGYMMRLGGGDKIHLENASNGWCMVNVDSNTPLTDGAWHFVAGVVDRDVGAAIYIDGALDATQEIDTSFANLSNDRNPTIGVADEQVQVSPEFFNGTIDDVRIYNIALSPGEVRALYSTERKTSVQ